ncbi:MAG TPA: F0F1 ATP synthase subunit B [Catalimonadaceae bacterium]|nr:F0F1 ATP synthase subunit B [Catalimonadaceae bacterium]HPI09452.1 F0F1 ATP synthase subunit B [Catalimonadaceae bacterium]
MELVTPDFGLLFWQVLTFLTVLLVLSKFAWKPIISGLKEREESIETALSEAKKAREEMASLTADNQKLILEARKERDKMLDEAQKMASTLIQEAKERANQESNRMIESARAEIQISKDAAIAELKNYLASTSLNIAEKVIRRNLSTDASQQQLVAELLSNTSNN